ncbi:MAG TPA: acetylxylan esterase, partial [Planctomycetaceae bacterium]|nr:acetylxylan esterase [Planctomycetaceae bacterium]
RSIVRSSILDPRSLVTCRWLEIALVAAVLAAMPPGRAGAEPSAATTPRQVAPPPFDLKTLSQVPAQYPAEGFAEPGVRALFYGGEPYQGKPTRVFAYYGAPAVPAGTKVPAMVLIHGGGGTAFDRWVRLWNSRGYAAIAMDLCGCIPVGTYGHWRRHDHGGPPGWNASFDQLESPQSDQWTYQAVTAILRGHTLLRSFPEVDVERIGMTGISWGGYLTCVTAGVDDRFKLAIPVYGCGFLGDNSAWLPQFEKLGSEKASLWLKQWDPSVYLPRARMPILWVNGTNDFAYPMDSWQKSYRLPKGARTLCLRVRMPHGHGPAGENPEEIHAFANSILKNGPPLATITAQGREGRDVWLTYTSKTGIAKAELNFTRDSGKWQDRKWESIPAELDTANAKVTARLPEGVTVYYLNAIDAEGLAVSGEHEELSP